MNAKPVISRCVICAKPQNKDYRPFCGKRCADVDLNRWLTGGYAIAAEEEDTPGDDERAPRADKPN